MSLGAILLILLIIALVGGFCRLGFYGGGLYAGGGLGLVLLIVLILVVLGRI